MEIFSGFFGKLFLAALIVLAVQQLWRWSGLGEYLRLRGARMAPTPSRISLESISNPDWADAPDAARDLTILREAGFTDVGAYAVVEMPGVEIVALVHTGDSLYAVVYGHPVAGTWSDIVARYDDGTARVASNAPTAGQMDSPPWTQNLPEPGATVARLLEALRDRAPTEGRTTASGDDFVAEFTIAYAREMDWRNSSGGVSEDEVRRVAAAMEGEFSDSVIEVAVGESRRQFVDRLAEECLANFLREAVLPVGQLAAANSGAAVTLHEQMTALEAIELLTILVDVPEDLYERLGAAEESERSGREVFAEIVNFLPVRIRPLLLGSTTEPVPADIWLSAEA